MTQADEIRRHVIESYIAPASQGQIVEVLAKNVRDKLGQNIDQTAVMGALTARFFLESQELKLMGRIGEGQGWQGVRYRLLRSNTDTLRSIPLAGNTSTRNEMKPDHNRVLREYILELSPSEFQELARQYLKSKGFNGAEIEISIKMKV